MIFKYFKISILLSTGLFANSCLKKPAPKVETPAAVPPPREVPTTVAMPVIQNTPTTLKLMAIPISDDKGLVRLNASVTFSEIIPDKPLGTVSFFSDSGKNLICKNVVVDNAQNATCTYQFRLGKIYNLVAKYSGVPNVYLPSEASTTYSTTQSIMTTLEVSSSAHESEPGEKIAYTVTLTFDKIVSNQPLGHLTLNDGQNSLCTTPVKVENNTFTSFCRSVLKTAGKHEIMAKYSGVNRFYRPSTQSIISYVRNTTQTSQPTLIRSTDPQTHQLTLKAIVSRAESPNTDALSTMSGNIIFYANDKEFCKGTGVVFDESLKSYVDSCSAEQIYGGAWQYNAKYSGDSAHKPSQTVGGPIHDVLKPNTVDFITKN